MRTFSDKERDEHISHMQSNMELQNESKVGPFWYSPASNSLFGVSYTYAMDVPFDSNGQKTSRTLHRDIWRKNAQRDTALQKRDSVWVGDYTKVPRGRVWQRKSDDKFYVTVGRWFEDYPNAKEQILFEFDLPDDTEFIYDFHWDIGRGWSE